MIVKKKSEIYILYTIKFLITSMVFFERGCPPIVSACLRACVCACVWILKDMVPTTAGGQDGAGWHRQEQDKTRWDRMKQDVTGRNRMEQNEGRNKMKQGGTE